MSRVYLVGFMGVGKSTVGKKLAYRMGYEFIDLDELFEKTYRISIDSFFGKYDEELFRDLEYKLLTETFKNSRVVISTGGGTACSFDAIEKMNTHGTTVFLDMPVSGIAQRLLHAKRKRPLVEGKNQEELIDFIADRLPARKQYYNKAQIKIDALNFNVEKLAAQIMSKIT